MQMPVHLEKEKERNPSTCTHTQTHDHIDEIVWLSAKPHESSPPSVFLFVVLLL
ncbi:Uncharacterized protein APZ42_015239 [Daphnia magna]|uniref:Uncharacterized protein n=1 Tax=Daphnia magna TaxID=35525 RepID=A0A162PAQ5_9CRUS|nr:Uncharacterized protein APZ42_015239 [Daphnia magna]